MSNVNYTLANDILATFVIPFYIAIDIGVENQYLAENWLYSKLPLWYLGRQEFYLSGLIS